VLSRPTGSREVHQSGAHRRGETFPYVHDLQRLLQILPEDSIPAGVRRATALTLYAIETRYPGLQPVDESEYDQAIELASIVVEWAEQEIGRENG